MAKKPKKYLIDDTDDTYSETISTFVDYENGGTPRLTDVTREHVLYGDTDSAYISLEAITDDSTPMEEVTEMGDFLGFMCNDSFPEYMQTVFNVPDERKHIIATDREVISDKSLFIKRKKYVMHIVDNEGVKCDKIKSMGVDYVRSDTPVVVRQFLKDMVEKLINGATYEETRQYVQDFKRKFRKMPLTDIGWPKGIKKLVDYENRFKQEGDMKGFPQHVRASMFWNGSREDADPEIVAGDKIKIIYLKEAEELPYIAFPADRRNLPEWLKRLEVDYKQQWALVLKKINIFLEPIGFDVSSRQRDVVKGAFEF